MRELDFFNRLSGKLKIDLSVPAQPIGNLLNLAAAPEARLVTLTLQPEVFVEETSEFRDLTPEEFDSVAYPQPRIRLRGESGEVVDHVAPNGRYFSVRDLLSAVEKTERQTRDNSEWIGGVDVHHVYFEGIHRVDDEEDVWEIYWGS